MAQDDVRWTGFFFRSLAFLLVWYVLTQGALTALPYGVPVAIAAAVAHRRLASSSGRVGWLHLATVLPRFFQLVFLGGVDVAKRALLPRLHGGRGQPHSADRDSPATAKQRRHVSTGQLSNHVRPWAASHSTLAIGPQSPGS